MRKFALLTVGLLLLCLLTFPVYAQAEGGGTTTMQTHWLAVAMAIDAGCGLAQSRAIAGGCEGVSRNPGAVDTIRFFVILGLAFIEFLALLTFVVVLII